MFRTESFSKCVRRGSVKWLVSRLLQLGLFAFAGIGAFLLRFDFTIPHSQTINLVYGLMVWLVAKPIVFRYFGLGRDIWRLVSVPDVLRLLSANLVASGVCTAGILTLAAPSFPRSIYFLDFALSLLLTAGIRITARIVTETETHGVAYDTERIFIYGAGAAGMILAREIRANGKMGYTVCGFIDDDPGKTGLRIHGIPVLGTGAGIEPLSRKHGVRQALIAVPSASGQQLTAIMASCASARLRFRTMPGVSEMIQGRGVTTQIRDVAVEDLLGRTPVQLDQEDIRAKLQDQVVAVTGAAGSIGSELCRQVAKFGPKQIVGIDVSETALFFLESEMQRSFPDLRFEPAIASVQNLARVSEVFQELRPAVVYHAAAYKHVPMMESHVFEAIENNVLGTLNAAIGAEEAGVRDFVMISSDKAVRPTSVMGLTKRIAEIAVSSFQNGTTKYVSVRFGNVLGSNGSVIPIFREQIAAGGPVTVTHPEMRRYFMTIPEAVQLVLQASTMGKGGEIFILDMGQPVKIVDLARNLILLSGLRPHEDIRIEFTGVRPGEKLSEELSALEERTVPTYHDKIRIFAGKGHIPRFEEWHEQVRRMCAERDLRILLEFKDLVPEYNPSSQVLRRLFERQQSLNPEPAPGRRAQSLRVQWSAGEA